MISNLTFSNIPVRKSLTINRSSGHIKTGTNTISLKCQDLKRQQK